MLICYFLASILLFLKFCRPHGRFARWCCGATSTSKVPQSLKVATGFDLPAELSDRLVALPFRHREGVGR